MKKKFISLIAAIFAITSISVAQNTVFDIIEGSADHDTLEAAIIAAGLDGTLSGPGPFTVFAPTDAAFAALPAGMLDALLADPSGDLTDILLYHVIGDSVGSGDLSNGMYAATVNGDSVIVTISGADVYIDNAMVTAANIDAYNGVVHVIDAVITPDTTVMDIIGGSADHNTLEAGIVAATLQSTLTGPGPFTVFAPTDAAFDSLPEGTLDALLADPMGDLTDILLYHVVGDKALSTDLSDGMLITTLNGDSVTVMIMNDTVYIDGAMVTVADLEATNGVVHVIDAVLMPRTTVVDIIVGSADHNTLEAAVIAADLAGTLSGDGPFTVFAPTDAAFAALPEGTLDALLADPSGDLTDILLYHVVGAKAMAADLSNGQVITTLNGESVEVSIDGSIVMINGTMVTSADLKATNGVVHVIDAVLLPPTAVEENINFENFSAYPNPAYDFVNLQFSLENAGTVNIEVYNLLGSQVMNTDLGYYPAGSVNTRLDVSYLQRGIYMVSVQSGSYRTLTKIQVVN